jgi:deoxyribodipyrimidine photo-lyase
MKEKVRLFWFRRDLRWEDNVALYHTLNDQVPVLPLFIFDQQILNELPKDDARVSFIYETLQAMREEIKQTTSSDIALYYGNPIDIFSRLLQEFEVEALYFNHDYEPYALRRDQEVVALMEKNGIISRSFKDQVIFEKNEVVKKDGGAYVVYTPYKNRWLELLNPSLHLLEYKTAPLFSSLRPTNDAPHVTLKEMGFTPSPIRVPAYRLTRELIQDYEAKRNFPAQSEGTSQLGPYLRFGQVSVRKIVERARMENNITFLQELIWREFFMQILWHFPHTVTQSFKPAYDRIPWRNNKEEFELWKSGNTGFPLIDAGMRQLNATGYMHNRVRMLVSSFLCKHLLIDWRWGEAYFAEKLLDYEQASNIGNWQWSAGSGVDAAPYFRIFNPTTQIQKFDKALEYISTWIPELQELTYSSPMVDHKAARERCLSVYKTALDNT